MAAHSVGRVPLQVMLITRGTLASLNALSGYESAEVSNFTVGSLTNTGVIRLAGGKTGNTLTVNGDYTGGGTLIINTVLGDDTSATDKLIVTGNTSGDTGVVVNNVRGGVLRPLTALRLCMSVGSLTVTSDWRIVLWPGHGNISCIKVMRGYRR